MRFLGIYDKFHEPVIMVKFSEIIHMQQMTMIPMNGTIPIANGVFSKGLETNEATSCLIINNMLDSSKFTSCHTILNI
jgi:hypothetical protein